MNGKRPAIDGGGILAVLIPNYLGHPIFRVDDDSALILSNLTIVDGCSYRTTNIYIPHRFSNLCFV